jgi:hypothetical protein
MSCNHIHIHISCFAQSIGRQCLLTGLWRCGLPQDGLLLINNYSKHTYWIFIKGLSCTEACLYASAGSLGLIGPAKVSSNQPTKDLTEVETCANAEVDVPRSV